MTNPFEAAIAVLKDKNEWMDFSTDEDLQPGWASPAVRLLESAGKVDKDDIQASFENICAEARVSGPNVDAIRSILEALPDSPGKE